MFKPMANILQHRQIVGSYDLLQRAKQGILPFHFEIGGRDFPRPLPRHWVRNLFNRQPQERRGVIQFSETGLVVRSPEQKILTEIKLNQIQLIQVGALRDNHKPIGHQFRAVVILVTDQGTYYFMNRDMNVVVALSVYALKNHIKFEDPLRIVSLLQAGWSKVADKFANEFPILSKNTPYANHK